MKNNEISSNTPKVRRKIKMMSQQISTNDSKNSKEDRSYNRFMAFRNCRCCLLGFSTRRMLQSEVLT